MSHSEGLIFSPDTTKTKRFEELINGSASFSEADKKKLIAKIPEALVAMSDVTAPEKGVSVQAGIFGSFEGL